MTPTPSKKVFPRFLSAKVTLSNTCTKQEETRVPTLIKSPGFLNVKWETKDFPAVRKESEVPVPTPSPPTQEPIQPWRPSWTLEPDYVMFGLFCEEKDGEVKIQEKELSAPSKKEIPSWKPSQEVVVLEKKKFPSFLSARETPPSLCTEQEIIVHAPIQLPSFLSIN